MTISTLGVGAGVVNVYDSLYESVSSYVENQVAAIVFTETEDITLNVIDVQKQSDVCDCGLCIGICHSRGVDILVCSESELFVVTKGLQL